MLNKFSQILAFMASNKDNKELNEALSSYLYREQRKNTLDQAIKDIDFDKYGSEIAKMLEKSIQKEIDKMK